MQIDLGPIFNHGIAIDPSGNIFVTDLSNDSIRIDSTGKVMRVQMMVMKIQQQCL